MSNREVLRKIGKGDRDAFSQYYKLQRRGLVSYAATLLAGDLNAAEDVVDDAFLDIWKKAAVYSEQGNDIGWLRRIVRNKAVDWLRKYGGIKIDISSMLGNLESHQIVNVDEMESQISDRNWLISALSDLNLQQREAVQFFYYEEMSLSEIALAMNCPENTVKSRLHYARKILHNNYCKETA